MSLTLSYRNEEVRLRRVRLTRGYGMRPVWIAEMNPASPPAPDLIWPWPEPCSLKVSNTTLGEQLSVTGVEMCADGGFALSLEGNRQQFADFLHKPKRRVIRTRDLLDLLQQLNVAVEDDRLRGSVRAHVFPGRQAREMFGVEQDEPACIIQAGLPDYVVVQRALQAFREECLLRGDDRLAHTHLGVSIQTGSPAISCGHPTFLRDAGPASAESSDAAGKPDWKMSAQRQRRQPWDMPEIGTEVWQEISFTGTAWEEHSINGFGRRWNHWRKMEVPCWFSHTKLPQPLALHRVEDTFDEVLEHGTEARWQIRLVTFPLGLPLTTAHGLPAWEGFGLAAGVESRNSGPWISVKLPQFSAEGDDQKVDARMETCSTGRTGDEGVYVEPAPGSAVRLSWSGRLGEPVVCSGNLRTKRPRNPSPSVAFLQPDEHWILKVGGKGILSAAKGLDIQGDGAALDIKEGRINARKL